MKNPINLNVFRMLINIFKLSLTSQETLKLLFSKNIEICRVRAFQKVWFFVDGPVVVFFAADLTRDRHVTWIPHS